MGYGKYLLLVALITFSEFSSGQTPSESFTSSKTSDLRLQRLNTLADIWGELSIHHHFLVGKEYEWDSVLTSSILQVEKTKTTEDFVGALNNSLFAYINDPLSYALTWEQCYDTSAPHINDTNPVSFKLNEKTGYVSVPMFKYSNHELTKQFYTSIKGLETIDYLVIDLRSIYSEWFPSDWMNIQGYTFDWLSLWADKELLPGPSVTPVYSFSRDLSWLTKGKRSLPSFQNYKSVLKQKFPESKTEKWERIDIPTIFLVNITSYNQFQNILDALQKQNNIAVVLDNSMPLAGSRLYSEKIRVMINSEMVIANDGALGARPDTILRNISLDNMPAIAESVFRNKSILKGNRTPFTFSLFKGDYPSSSTSLTREQKIMVLMKIWVNVKNFYAYPKNMTMDWNNMLFEWIPKIERTTNMQEYYDVLHEATSKINDSHVSIQVFRSDAPVLTIPASLLKIQGKVIVAQIIPTKDPRPLLSIGDEIIAVDGKKITEIENIFRKKLSLSSETNLYRNVWELGLAFSLNKDSMVVLTILNKKGKKEIFVKKTERRFTVASLHPFGRKLVEILPGNIGYLRLYDIASLRELDSALFELQNTRGLICDTRTALGWPKLAAEKIFIDRFFKEPFEYKDTKWIYHFTQFGNPVTALGEHKWNYFPSQDNNMAHYYKPMIIITNSHTGSFGENILQMFQYAKRAGFVGSPTGGTSGAAGWINLPDDAGFRFTDQMKLTPDGSNFHGVGIVPEVRVEATIKGIRERKDEVLEKAIETLNKKIKEWEIKQK